MSMRAIRVETRSRHKDDIKRAMHSVVRVRKWEKKWVRIGDTSMQIFKWMPLKSEEIQSTAGVEASLITADNAPSPQTATKTISSTLKSDPKVAIKTNQMLNNEPLSTDSLAKTTNQNTHTMQSDNIVDDSQFRSTSSMAAMSNEANNYNSESSESHLSSSPPSKRIKTTANHYVESNGSSSASQSSTPQPQGARKDDLLSIEINLQNQSHHSGPSSTVSSEIKTNPPQAGDQEQQRDPTCVTPNHPIHGANSPLYDLKTTIIGSGHSLYSQHQTNETKDTQIETDVDMMDTDLMLANSSTIDQATKSGPLADAELNPMDLEEFSIVARLVTDQIVTRVSDCHMGGDTN